MHADSDIIIFGQILILTLHIWLLNTGGPLQLYLFFMKLKLVFSKYIKVAEPISLEKSYVQNGVYGNFLVTKSTILNFLLNMSMNFFHESCTYDRH